MKKNFLIVFAVFLFFLSLVKGAYAQHTDIYDFPYDPIPCNKTEPSLSCPDAFVRGGTSGQGIYGDLSERCATSYADFLSDPIGSHYWVEDPAITTQGKSNERARQFLYWVINVNVIDEAPVLRTIWGFSSLVALIGVILVTAVFGIGYIINRRSEGTYNGIGRLFSGENNSIAITPTLIKIGAMLLYIAFSAAIVLVLIQFSEILMKFFFDNLGGKDLFNIYFANDTTLGATELNYKSFVGCRDINIRVQESINTQTFLLKLTNISYYAMGIMFLLRKILLWFLLFVSPFLALLMPFIFIRNTGWIWIGVFFQWLFYGPLVALFLGGLSKIWKEGIPFSFDFSRAGELSGYIYTTGINIVYGGPAQRISGSVNRPIGALNNVNYIDTFAEYVITLIMLWAVLIFPWWLLRIFRDYCCEGIYAMKNILLAMYDNMRGSPSKSPSPIYPPSIPNLKIDTKTPFETKINVSLGSLEQIKKTITKDISHTMNLSATHITDIAKIETNKQLQHIVNQNLANISNPVKSTTSNQRQQFMNLRSELFNRAIKNDTMAQAILASTSNSQSEKIRIRENILRSIPQTISISQVLAKDIKIPKETLSKITNSYTAKLANNNQTINNISKSTGADVKTISNILNTYNQYTDQPLNRIISLVANHTNTSEKIVQQVLRSAGSISAHSSFIQSIASTHKLQKEQVTKVIQSIQSVVSHSQTISDHTASKTQTSTDNVRSLIQDTFSQTRNNVALVTKIAQNTASTPQIVSSIMNSYIESVDSNPKNTIQNIAKSVNVPHSTVISVLKEVSSQIQTHPYLQETAQKIGINLENAKSIISTSIDIAVQSAPDSRSAIDVISEQVKPSTITTQSVTNIINSLSTSADAISHIAKETQISEEIVSKSLSTFASNLTQNTYEILNTISRNTNISNSEIQKIIQSAASYTVGNQSIQNQIFQTTTTPVNTVSNIMHSIAQSFSSDQIAKQSQTISSQIQNTSTNLQSISQDKIKSIYEAFGQNTQCVTYVSNNESINSDTVKNILNSFSQNINEPAHIAIQNIAKETNSSIQAVQQVLSSVSNYANQYPESIQSVAQSTSTDETIVKDVIQTSKEVVEKTREASMPASEKLVSSKSTVTEEDIQKTIASLSDSEITTQIAKETNISQDLIQNTINEFAQNLNQPSNSIVNKIQEKTKVPSGHIIQIIKSIQNTISSNDQALNSISNTTHIPLSNVRSIVDLATSSVVSSQADDQKSIVEKIKEKEISDAKTPDINNIVHNIIQTISQNTSVISTIAQKTNTQNEFVQSVIKLFGDNIKENTSNLVASIAKSANTTTQQIQNILITTADIVKASSSTVNMIATKVNTSESVVQRIVNSIPQVLTVDTTQSTDSIKEISFESQTNEKISSEIIRTLMNTVIGSDVILNNLAQDQNLKPQQIKNICTTYTNNIHEPVDRLIQTINESSGVPKDQVRSVISAISKSILTSDEIIGSVAKSEGVSEKEVAEAMQTQLDITSNPDQNIEKAISIPQTISLEDYEEVKEMWIKHYEEGEVPVSETIKTRNDWIEQEIVYITNTMNKILSGDEKLQQEGLDELGFLLPIFLINNLKGDELIVYLKAKLEAAKLVMKILERENAIKTKMENENMEEEVFVDIPTQTQEAEPQHMALNYEDDVSQPKTNIPENFENAEKPK